MSDIHKDPESGRYYQTDAAGNSQWINDPPQRPVRPERSHRMMWATIIIGLCILAFVGIGLIVSAAPEGTEVTVPAGISTDESATASRPDATMGASVRDGKLEFTVTEIVAEVESVGPSDLKQKPQGEFVVVHLTIRNIGEMPALFDASNQIAMDAEGHQFGVSDATFYVTDSNSFLEDINPGNVVGGVVVFDVPKGTKLVRLELHDSPLSGGAVVAVES